jgi:hypothetical protein
MSAANRRALKLRELSPPNHYLRPQVAAGLRANTPKVIESHARQKVLNAIAGVARKLGRAPTRSEFIARSGISAFFVLQSFVSWNDAVRAAGLRPHTLNKKIEDRALLEDWGTAVRKKGGMLPRHVFRREGKYNPCTLAKRFGGWMRVHEAFRNFAKGKREWDDVVAFLPAPVPPGRCGRAEEDNGQRRKAAATNQVQHATLKDRAIYGNSMPLSWFRHEPVNEQGVVLLFGMVAKELGYMIERVQTGFPDCEAKRRIGPDRWQRVNIEFEFESKNYREHGHPLDGCDVIVCWRHNWNECPEHIEVVELSRVIESLTTSQD